MLFLENIWNLMLELAPWLFVGTVMASLLHIWLPPDFINRRLGSGGPSSVLRAVVFGVPLPLCSCAVIPATVSLKKEGAGQGSALGFLIATPQTGVDSILVTASMLGWPFALFKVVAALVTGVAGGVLADRKGLSNVSDQQKPDACCHDHNHAATGWREALNYGLYDLLYPIWGWLLVGLIASALITTWVPEDQFSGLAGAGIWTLLLTIFISMPLYVCATASVPVAAALVISGFPEGAALVFLLVGPATNIATIGAVHRLFGMRILVIYILTVIVGSVSFGMIFDAFWGLQTTGLVIAHQHHSLAASASAVLLTGLLGWFGIRDLRQMLRMQNPNRA
tara:strand:- start:895 stop:1908 length:1014 start_codon:yes stop_codon:yes gene_type:complete